MRRTGALVATTLAATLLVACGGDAPAGPNAATTVMVVDEGFDLEAPALRGKVIGAFTVECRPTASPDEGVPGGEAGAGEDGGADAGPPFDEVKRRYIARLAISDDSCHLREGISPKEDPFATVARYRSRWNEMLRAQRFGNQVFSEAEWQELMTAMSVESDHLSAHGTATAGVVARANDHVRLVLVERTLSDPTKIAQGFSCFVQSELDVTVAMLLDPEVLDAYVHAPRSSYSQELTDVRQRLEVGFVNESFNAPARAELEALQASKGCAAVDLKPYFSALHDVQVAWTSGRPIPNELHLQSAGNASLSIESGMDERDCLPEDPTHLFVGADDLAGVVSQFSNRGPCVDLFAPGEDVIAPYAGGWLLPVWGTSFAAPLVAGRLSRITPAPFDTATARGIAIERPKLSVGDFTSDLFYAPGGLPAIRSALTTPSRRRTPPTRFSPIDMKETLRPLTLLQEARARVR